MKAITVKMLQDIAENVECEHSHDGIVHVKFTKDNVLFGAQFDCKNSSLYAFEILNPMQMFFPELIKEE